ncbi:MAG: GldG family protein [Nitrospira sp.]
MNVKSLPLGILGIVLGLGGMITYSLRPDWLWAVTITEGLALVCLVLFFVFHFETVKAFSSRRSTRMGLNSFLMIVLFSGILVIVNFLASRHSVRWDLSENQNFTLAPQTYRVLRTLPREVKITVFTREKDPGYQVFKERLESYRQASTKLGVEFIDPEKQPKIAQSYGIFRTDTAIFESNGQTIRVTSPSEVELTGALIRISKDTKKRIVFVEGHSELNVEDKDRNGLSIAKEALLRQGYEVGSVSLLKESAVPDNTSVLVLAGPRRSVTKDEQDRIQAYVEKGGHLLLLADPDTQTGLESLLTHWGLGVGPRGVGRSARSVGAGRPHGAVGPNIYRARNHARPHFRRAAPAFAAHHVRRASWKRLGLCPARPDFAEQLGRNEYAGQGREPE